jgi:hypothetical protein
VPFDALCLKSKNSVLLVVPAMLSLPKTKNGEPATAVVELVVDQLVPVVYAEAEATDKCAIV